MPDVTAQVWVGDSRFETRILPLAPLSDGELLLALDAATICGSDRHTVSGRRQAPCPSVLGHEGVGRIVESARAGYAPGERLVFSVTAACHDCDRCHAGLTAKCRNLLKTGHEPVDGPWPASGTYADHIVLRPHQPVARIADHIPDGPAATAACAVATVMAVMEAAGDLEGKRVLINGVGMLGVVAVAAARSARAEAIHARDGVPERVALALAAGADAADTLSASVPVVDVALEFSGVAAGVDSCLEALDVGGVAVLAGSVAPGPKVEIDPETLVRRWHTIRGVHNYEPRHLTQAAEFLAGPGRDLPWEEILAGPYPLSTLQDIFTVPAEALRVVVTP